MLLSLRRNLLRYVGVCLGRNRILGVSVVRYCTGELTPEVNCISGQCTNYIATYWGKVKWTETGRVQVLSCCKLSSEGKRKENLDGKFMRRNLDSRVSSK